MSDAIEIHYDFRLEGGAVRAAALKAVERLGWAPAAKRREYGPVVCVGRASALAKVDFRRLSCAAVGVLALWKDEKDAEALADLDEASRSAWIALRWVRAERVPRPERLEEWLEELADSLRPERVRFARFANGTLFVTFGDGVSHAFDWRKTRLLSKLRAADPETAHVSDEKDAVVVQNSADGSEIDVDGLVLRRIVDAEVAAESSADFVAARSRFGARLRSMREAAKLSQVELSARAGISQEAISRLETGTRAPRLETLKRLARGLEVALPTLLNRLEQE